MRKIISELANVTGGQIVVRLMADKAKGETGKEIGTIVAKTVKNGYLSHEDIVYNEYRADPDLKKFVKKGDIVIKLTQPLGASLIEEGEEGLLVSSFCAIITDIDVKKVDPRYLAAYLNSEPGMQAIASIMGGSTIQTVSINNLRNLPIPYPSMQTQKDIGQAFGERVLTEKLSLKLIELRQEKVNAMIAELEDDE